MNDIAVNGGGRAPNLNEKEMVLFASINRQVPVGIAS